MNQKNKWVLFDMDGTLWDAVDVITDSWNAVCAAHPELGVTVTRETLRGLLGQPMNVFAKTVFPSIPAEEAEELVHECERLENAWVEERGANLYPGVENVFQELIRDGWHLAIVSNCQSGYIEAFLNHYGYRKYISDTLCFGDNGLSKGENIRMMADRHRAELCCYIGDTPTDREASDQAGVPFYWASYGFGDARGSREVPQISDLPEILRRDFPE